MDNMTHREYHNHPVWLIRLIMFVWFIAVLNIMAAIRMNSLGWSIFWALCIIVEYSLGCMLSQID